MKLSSGYDTGCKFGSYMRVIDVMTYVKSGKILLLIFRNVIKAYEQFRDGQPQDKDPSFHGYMHSYSFFIHV